MSDQCRQILAAVVVLTTSVCSVLSLHAQERLELVTHQPSLDIIFEEVDIGLSRFGEIRNVTPTTVRTRNPWVAVSGGRFLVASAGSARPALIVFDRRSRQVLGGIPVPFQAQGLVADPMRPRLFIHDSPAFIFSRIGVFDAATMTFREFEAPASFVTAMAYAPGPDLLFVVVYQIKAPPSIFVYDVATGLRVRELPGYAEVRQMTVDTAGQRLYISGRAGRWDAPLGLVAYDVKTGTEIARASIETYEFAIDEPRGLLLVNKNREGRLMVLDARSLSTLLDVRIDPSPGQEPGLYRFFLPIVGQGRIGGYLLRTTTGRPSPERTICYEINLDVFEPDGSRRTTADLLAPLGELPFCDFSAVVLRAPRPPSGLAANVDGHSVTITWENPGNVTDFNIEVGLTPGGRGLTRSAGFVTSIVARDVPSGVYYVRVRATNEIGTSGPSSELQVVVP